MRWTRPALRCALLALVFFTLVGQDQCPPDYSKPDASGPLPPGTGPIVQRFQEKVPANPPDPLTCDRAVYQTITLSQPNVNCEAGHNYVPLFDAAKGLADGIAAASVCPGGCAPLHTWIERLTTECLGTTAGIVLEIGLLCPRPDTARPAGVQITRADPRLTGPPMVLPNPQPPAKPSIGDVTGTLPGAPVACRPVEPVEFRYREEAACGNPGFDYKPYVDRAERRAPAVCNAVGCAAGCAKTSPPTILRSRWNCRNGKEVDIRVDVQCCQ